MMPSPSAISNVLAHAMRNLSDQAVIDQFGDGPLVVLLLKYRERSRADLPFMARCRIGNRYARAFRIFCGYREPTRRVP